VHANTKEREKSDLNLFFYERSNFCIGTRWKWSHIKTWGSIIWVFREGQSIGC